MADLCIPPRTRPKSGTLGSGVREESRDPLAGTHFTFSQPDGGSRSLMTVASPSQVLYGFAVELRQLAYTMPGGHENPLIQLSERMVRCAVEQAAEQ